MDVGRFWTETAKLTKIASSSYGPPSTYNVVFVVTRDHFFLVSFVLMSLIFVMTFWLVGHDVPYMVPGCDHMVLVISFFTASFLW